MKNLMAFDKWVVEVTRHELREIPTRLHGYLHTAFAQGVDVETAQEAHAEQKRLTRKPYERPTVRDATPEEEERFRS